MSSIVTNIADVYLFSVYRYDMTETIPLGMYASLESAQAAASEHVNAHRTRIAREPVVLLWEHDRDDNSWFAQAAGQSMNVVVEKWTVQP